MLITILFLIDKNVGAFRRCCVTWWGFVADAD